MRISLGKKLILLSAVAATSAFANPNACDDYLARHNRRNLVPTKIVFQDKNFSSPYQEVQLTLKNSGERDLATSPTPWMKVKIKNSIRSIQVSMPVRAGESVTLSVAIDAGTLKHCEETSVAIDLDHSIGQWGCQVWNDDTKTLKAFRAGLVALCNIPIPIRPILPPHIPVPPTE